MGSISSVNTRPNTWPTNDENKKLKQEYGGEELITVEYGTYEDYPDGQQKMTILMRKSVYEKCLSGEYKVAATSQSTLRLLDNNGKQIPQLSPDIIY